MDTAVMLPGLYHWKNAMRMMFVSNHDKNAWEGTMREQFGEGLQAAIVLSVIGEGMPLVYNGQEAGNNKRLEFFEKDPIEWKNHPLGELYQKLLALKKANTALWNAQWGANMIKIANNEEQAVLSFVRKNEKNKVFAVFNFSNKRRKVKFQESLHHGTYTDYFRGNEVQFVDHAMLDLDAWGYSVFIHQ